MFFFGKLARITDDVIIVKLYIHTSYSSIIALVAIQDSS